MDHGRTDCYGKCCCAGSQRADPVCVIQATAFAQDLRKKETVILKQPRCHSEAAFPEGIGHNSGQQVVETVAPGVGHHDLGSSRTIPLQAEVTYEHSSLLVRGMITLRTTSLVL